MVSGECQGRENVCVCVCVECVTRGSGGEEGKREHMSPNTCVDVSLVY